MELNEKKLYMEPVMKVIMIEATDIIATSGDPDPDEIYPNLRD